MLGYVVVSVICCGAADGGRNAGGGSPQFSLELRSNKQEYVVGEPVVLLATLKSQAEKPVKLWPAHVLPPQRGGVEVLLGREDAPLTQYVVWTQCPTILLDSIELGRPWRFHIRVLYAPASPSGRAFDAPGRYRVKIIYPLVGRHMDDTAESNVGTDDARPRGRGRYRWEIVESNELSLTVRAPQGRDLEVWQEIQRREFLYFLQFGRIYDGHQEVVSRLVGIASRTPETSYHPGIRWALRWYYAWAARHGKRSELAAVRKALAFPTRAVYSVMEDRYYLLPAPGEPIPHAERLFPDDPRLDKPVALPAMEFQPIRDVLKYLERNAGVRLQVSLAITLAHELLLDAPIRQTLRELMASVAVPGTQWVKDGEGYMLVPVVEEKRKRE
jgi:hypothetical protein